MANACCADCRNTIVLVFLLNATMKMRIPPTVEVPSPANEPYGVYAVVPCALVYFITVVRTLRLDVPSYLETDPVDWSVTSFRDSYYLACCLLPTLLQCARE